MPFGKNGLFRVLSRRKWTILIAFLGESGLFCAFFGEKWTILAKIVDHFGHFWTMGGCFRTPRTPPGYGPDNSS